MIVCIGTTPVYQRTMTFERLTLDQVNRAKEVRDYASGKSINVARVAKTLGADVVATGFIGGPRGRLLLDDLDGAGIRHEFAAVAAQTRQCITVIDRSAATATELVEESAPVEEEAWKVLDSKLHALLPQANVWIFSGTLAPGGPADFYARWLPLAAQLGASAIIDARGEPLRLSMQHPNGILKMNREEFAATMGEIGQTISDERSLLDAMRRHVPANGKLIVTLGPAGALACEAKHCRRVVAPPVDAVSAVGSGDAFAAGLAVAFQRVEEFDQALKLAAACGAANATTPLAGHVKLSDVNRLQASVSVEPI